MLSLRQRRLFPESQGQLPRSRAGTTGLARADRQHLRPPARWCGPARPSDRQAAPGQSASHQARECTQRGERSMTRVTRWEKSISGTSTPATQAGQADLQIGTDRSQTKPVAPQRKSSGSKLCPWVPMCPPCKALKPREPRQPHDSFCRPIGRSSIGPAATQQRPPERDTAPYVAP